LPYRDSGLVQLNGWGQVGRPIVSGRKGKRVEARYDGDTLWMSVAEVAQLFGRSVSVITRHIASVVEEGELPRRITCKKCK
jgi:hypothetical protein